MEVRLLSAALVLRQIAPSLACVVLMLCTSGAAAMTPQQRREYRDKLTQILPDVPAFNEWLKATDELPPDFDALPRCNGLPDPLTFLDGRAVKTPDDWKARRDEIRQLFERYAWGSIPPLPKMSRADISQEAQADGYRTRNIVIRFGPDGQASMRVTLIIPEGAGPFPVLMGPGLVGGFGNTAATVLRRGYITASYAGNDFSDDSRTAVDLYKDFDFATLPRRAWAASVVLDYLQTMLEADMTRVAIYGYSRDGKQIMIAAALDERIGAVIAGSTGVGGVTPYRLAGERNHAEGIESTTRMFPDWFHPRLRFFSGREDRLPVDGNLLLALVAPRPCIMVSGFNDQVANTWGDEQSLHSAAKVYELLGVSAAQKLGLLRVPGFHGANDIERAIDFLDIQFGRSPRQWRNEFVFPWDFEDWKQRSGATVDLSMGQDSALANIGSIDEWQRKTQQIRASVESMLGEAPPLMPPAAGPGGGGRGRGGAAGAARGPATTTASARGNPGQVTPDLVNWVIQQTSRSYGWFADEAAQTSSRSIRFGHNVRGDLYYPAGTPSGAKLPTVIWLHSYSYPLGYMRVYQYDLHPVLALVKEGYAVLAFDQCGFGSRMSEAAAFYERWPKWSMMGRMVEDVRAVVGALQRDELVDPDRIYLFGYSLGGNVALHAAALDSRIGGVVSICGFTPMRTDTAERGAGGIARYSIERPLIPRLGLYLGNESKVPYDFDELIAAIAPRPVYVLQPQLDRDAHPADVRAAVERARQVYTLHSAADRLQLDEPWDYNRLHTGTQDRVIAWMKQQMK